MIKSKTKPVKVSSHVYLPNFYSHILDWPHYIKVGIIFKLCSSKQQRMTIHRTKNICYGLIVSSFIEDKATWTRNIHDFDRSYNNSWEVDPKHEILKTKVLNCGLGRAAIVVDAGIAAAKYQISKQQRITIYRTKNKCHGLIVPSIIEDKATWTRNIHVFGRSYNNSL